MLEKFFNNQIIQLVCWNLSYSDFEYIFFSCLNLDRQFSIEFSHFNQYLYFLFAPTLLYRDIYPRTSIIQWNIVWKMFGQFMIILFLVYNIITNFWMPTFTRFFTNNDITLEFTILTIFDLMLPGVLIVILGKISCSFILIERFSVFLLSFLWIFSLLVEWICGITSICWSNVLWSKRK